VPLVEDTLMMLLGAALPFFCISAFAASHM